MHILKGIEASGKEHAIKTKKLIVIIALVAIVGFFILAILFTLKAHFQQALDSTATLSAIRTTPMSTASLEVDVGATATELWYKANPLAQHPFTETVGPSPTATATPLARGIKPPVCTFPLAQTTSVESKPEQYIFSQPKILRNALPGNLYASFGWMPDNQQIFVTEDLRHDFVQTNDNDIRNTIYLYTPATGKVKVYANAVLKILGPLWWVSESNAIVYPAMRFFDIDRKNGTYKLDRQIRVSYGDETDQDQILVHNLSELIMAVKPDGSTLIYLADKKISSWDQSLKAIPPVPFDLAHWDYATSRRGNQPVLYKTAWQPNSSKVFLYSAGYTGGGGYTFLLDTVTGDICELDISGWARSARWSSDGRYLALHRSTTYGYTDFPLDMIVLDTLTGKLSVVYFIPKEKKERFSIIDFAWAPDNRHLLALRQDVKSLPMLYLADFISGQSFQVLPGNNLYATSPDTLEWSPDGSKLVFRCPTKLIDRICFVSVQRTGK